MTDSPKRTTSSRALILLLALGLVAMLASMSPAIIAPTLPTISAWYRPIARCASACFGASFSVLSRLSFTLPARPCASAFATDSSWL